MTNQPEPIVLTSSDKVYITGKGMSYMLKAPFEMSVERLKLNGVIMDGEYKLVRGVERFVVHIGKPMILEGETIGLLLVDGDTK